MDWFINRLRDGLDAIVRSGQGLSDGVDRLKNRNAGSEKTFTLEQFDYGWYATCTAVVREDGKILNSLKCQEEIGTLDPHIQTYKLLETKTGIYLEKS